MSTDVGTVPSSHSVALADECASVEGEVSSGIGGGVKAYFTSVGNDKSPVDIGVAVTIYGIVAA